MDKAALRTDLLTRRRSMEHETWRCASAAAQRRLADSEMFRRAECIALYSPVQREVDTSLLFSEARSAGKKVLYPAVHENQLQFREVIAHDLCAVGRFGIPEPCAAEKDQSLDTADLFVVPGVAFDLHGCRIGFGKGYYDRYLARFSKQGILVGFCHDFQLLDIIPCEGHDIRMQYVVTDKRLILTTGDEGRNRPDAGLT